MKFFTGIYFLILIVISLVVQACGGRGNYHHIELSSQHSPHEFRFLDSFGPEIKGSKNLNMPVDIAFDVGGLIFICDKGNNRIVKLDREHNFIREIGGFGMGNEQLTEPAAVTFDNGLTLIVVDSHQRKIKRFDRNLNYIDSFSEFAVEQGVISGILNPQGISASWSGDIYISDTGNNRVLVLDSFFKTQIEIGGFGSGYGELSDPRGLVTGMSDNLYVADSGNRRIAVYNSLGEYEGDFGYSRLRSPVDITMGPDGFLYITDEILKSILVFSPSGKFITDSAEWNIYFNEPAGLQFSPDGNLYVADSRGRKIVILRITR